MPAPPPSFVVNKNPERIAESQTALIIGIIATANILALAVVAAKTYTRLVISKAPGAQDALMVLSACTGLAGTIILFLQIPYGLGKHADTIERTDYAIFNKYSFIHTVVPLLGGIGLLKIAIALELMKYNGNSWRWYNITLKCLIGFVVAYTFEAWMAAAIGVVKAVSQMKYNPTGDTTYLYDIQFWGLLQLNVGTIAACAPSLRPLVKNILRLKSLPPVYGYTNSGQRQGSIPISARGGARIPSGVSQADFELNNRQSPRNDQSRNADYGDIAFRFKNSSQVAILDTDRLEKMK
ncbi:hypothetical protein HG530_013133 [Fusarium avenaceum]|nr:hypothetical protein HG530_013133 [Fusarium avenaceum]